MPHSCSPCMGRFKHLCLPFAGFILRTGARGRPCLLCSHSSQGRLEWVQTLLQEDVPPRPKRSKTDPQDQFPSVLMRDRPVPTKPTLSTSMDPLPTPNEPLPSPRSSVLDQSLDPILPPDGVESESSRKDTDTKDTLSPKVPKKVSEDLPSDNLKSYWDLIKRVVYTLGISISQPALVVTDPLYDIVQVGISTLITLLIPSVLLRTAKVPWAKPALTWRII